MKHFKKCIKISTTNPSKRRLTCVRAFVRFEMRTFGIHLVAALGIALVYLAVLGEIIVAAAIGRGVSTERGAAARTAAAKVDAAEAAAILAAAATAAA